MDIKNKKEFIGRQKELSLLRDLAQLNRAALIVINGRRRIGKSRIAAEFAKDKIFLSFSGLTPVDGVTAQDQRDAFARQLSFLCNIPPFTFFDWFDGFAHLARQLSAKKTVILLDEISWMGSEDPTFLPKLKIWWDQISEQRSNLMLILCGSVSTWIENNIINSTAFFGRVSLHLTLGPLSIEESHLMLKSRGIQASAYDIFRILSVTGGIPWYLENINKAYPIDENIKRLCFSSNGLLVSEFDHIFHDLFDRRGDMYKKIVETLALGMRDYSQVREALNYSQGGALAPYLDALVTSGYVTKHQSWSLKTGKPASKSLFRLSDNYVRFYMKVIMPLLSKIKNDSFADVPLSAVPGWNSIMGLQVENLLLTNRSEILKAIHVHPQDVSVDNPFRQRQNKLHAGTQIDYLIQTITNTLYVCEFKFSKNEVRSDVIQSVQQKIDALAIPRGFSVAPVLFHFGGVSDAVFDARYFYKIVDISDFL